VAVVPVMGLRRLAERLLPGACARVARRRFVVEVNALTDRSRWAVDAAGVLVTQWRHYDKPVRSDVWLLAAASVLGAAGCVERLRDIGELDDPTERALALMDVLWAAHAVEREKVPA
jgi:hypothetical protein